MPHFTIDHVNLKIDGQEILKDITLSFAEKRVGIVGANGSGKSSFVRLLNGLVKPSSGTLKLDDLDIVQQPKLARRHVGFVFQNPDHQIVYPTVEEDLGFGLKNLKLDRSEIDTRLTQILDRFDLSHLKKRLCHTLSGGEKQMIALLGVAVMAPEVVVLDEPTTLLDLRHKCKILSMIEQLEQNVVMVTHDLELLAHFDRVLCFDRGRLVKDGPPDEVVALYKELMGA